MVTAGEFKATSILSVQLLGRVHNEQFQTTPVNKQKFVGIQVLYRTNFIYVQDRSSSEVSIHSSYIPDS